MHIKSSSLFLFILGIMFFSCKSDKPVIEKDTVLDIAVKKDPRVLNPLINLSSSARIFNMNIFVPMADFHPETYVLTPILIKSIPEGEEITEGPSKGGTKYTVELREDAKWDNGSPITAKDLLFTIKAIKHPGTNANSYRSAIKSITDLRIDPENDRKATFYFKDYYILSKELAVTLEIYPQYHYDPEYATDAITIMELDGPNANEIIAKDPKLKAFAEAFNSVKYTRDEPSGSGPYRLKEWVSNQLVVLEKKENYWGDNLDIPALEGNVKEIRFHIIADETAAISQLKEGNIDVYTDMSANSFFDLQKNETFGEDFEYFTPILSKYYYIALNNSKPELSDPDVRRALAKLIDVPKLVDVLEGGLGQQTVGIINTQKPYYNKTLSPIKKDIEGAKKILAEEGWADTNNDGTIDKELNGKKVEMVLDMYLTKSRLSQNVGLIMQEGAKNAGVKINLITKEYSDTKRENIAKRDYHMAPLVLSQDLVIDDPYGKWHSDNDNPNGGNNISYNSKKADELINIIRSTQDDKTREQYYTELQEVMYEDQPVIFLYNPQEKIIISKRWKGTATIKRPGIFPGTFVAN